MYNVKFLSKPVEFNKIDGKIGARQYYVTVKYEGQACSAILEIRSFQYKLNVDLYIELPCNSIEQYLTEDRLKFVSFSINREDLLFKSK